jgi:FlaA1/EpsC-like NDP-sugar epimerase
MSPDFRRGTLTTTAKVFDLAAVSLSFLASFAISSGSFTWPDLADLLVMRIKVANLLLFAGFLSLCIAVFSACGFYRSHRLSHWKQRLREMIFAATFVTGAFLVVQQLFRISFAMSIFLPSFWFFTLCGLLLSHELAMRLLRVARLHGRNLRNVVIVGEGPDALVLADRVRQEAGRGYRILRIIDAGEMGENARITGDI